MKKILTFLITFLFAFTISVNAEGYIMDDNFYLEIQDNIEVVKEVNGSGFYVGQKIKVEETINGIGFIVAEDININSRLENGVLIGSNIILNGIVDRDLFVASGNFYLTKDSKLNRDLFVTSNKVIIEGHIIRDVFIGSNEVVIKNGAKINGNVRISANKINIEEDVLVSGTLKYNDTASVDIKNKEEFNVETYKGALFGKDNEKRSSLLKFTYKVISMFLLFALIYYFFPKLFNTFGDTKREPINYLKNIGVGFIVFILTPLLSLFLFVIPYTFPIGLLTFVLYFISLYLSKLFIGYLLGEHLREYLFKKTLPKYVVGMLGILLVQILTLIPGANFIVILLSLGMIYELVLSSKREVPVNKINKEVKKVETKESVARKTVVKKKSTKK